MEQLINFIIRPPRAEYNPKHDLLDQEFMLKGRWYQRKDLEVVNSRGDTLQCSHYMPIFFPEGKSLPCVIYCHGNSGCRTDASEAAVILLPSNITVFTLDFSGSGLSGGEHVTLGWNEKDDLKTVVDYLRSDGNVSFIGLWGRSMGAVTSGVELLRVGEIRKSQKFVASATCSLMYGAEDPSIAGMVLDSPFSDLVDLMMELVDTYKVRVPKFTVKFVIQYMRRAIQKKANFDIMNLNATKVAKSCFVPVLLGHAMDDDFIQPHHSDRILDAYVGDKNIIKFEGDHNSPRPQFYFDSISIFFKNVLHPPENEAGSDYLDFSNDYIDQGRWSILSDTEFSDELLDSPVGTTAGNTDDAIRQLRSKRPMSSVVVPSSISSKDSQSHPKGPDSHPSSSNMISFEFSKDSSRGSSVPQSMDEEEYVEYPLDVLADFPTNVEEEERMLMEAVLESLKATPSGVVEPSSNGPKTEKEPMDDKSSVSTRDNILKTKVVLTSASEDKKSVSDVPLLGSLDASSSESPTKCSPTSEETQEACSSSNTSVPIQKFPITNSMNYSTDSSKYPSPDLPARQTTYVDTDQFTCDSHKLSSNLVKPESDIADRTTVTVEVEKKEATNVMDGLLRRLDLNFFRNR